MLLQTVLKCPLLWQVLWLFGTGCLLVSSQILPYPLGSEQYISQLDTGGASSFFSSCLWRCPIASFCQVSLHLSRQLFGAGSLQASSLALSSTMCSLKKNNNNNNKKKPFIYSFFGCTVCGILVPQPGVEPTPPAVEARSLNIGPPGKSLHDMLLMHGNVMHPHPASGWRGIYPEAVLLGTLGSSSLHPPSVTPGREQRHLQPLLSQMTGK